MTVKVGQIVKAFHPGYVGVVKEGKVTKIGSKYIYVEFGINGPRRILEKDIVSTDANAT